MKRLLAGPKKNEEPKPKFEAQPGDHYFHIAYKKFNGSIDYITVPASDIDSAIEKLDESTLRYLSIESWDSVD